MVHKFSSRLTLQQVATYTETGLFFVGVRTFPEAEYLQSKSSSLVSDREEMHVGEELIILQTWSMSTFGTDILVSSSTVKATYTETILSFVGMS